MMRTDANRLIQTAALMLLLAVAPAYALQLGETAQASITLANKQLPLPEGSWIVAGLGVQELAPQVAGPFGVIRTAILLQLSGDRVTSIAEFNTNDIGVSDGWGKPGDCENAPTGQSQLRYHSHLDASCVFVTSTQTAAGGSAAWQQALAYAASRHLRLAGTMLTAGFVVSDRQDMVDARLHFDPEAFPPEAEAERLLLDWAVQFSPLFAAGIANQLSGPPLPGPLRGTLLGDAPLLDRNLLELEGLRRAGVITPADALTQQQAALTEQPRSAKAQVVDTNGWYYFVGTPVINFVTAYGVTQNAPLAIAITATEQIAHSLLFAANRAGWDHAIGAAEQHRVPWPALAHIGTRSNLPGPAS